MTSVEASRPIDVNPLTKKSLQIELLQIPNLPEGPKGMMNSLFSGKTQATDGDTFITFSNPRGGFFTVDVISGDLFVAWHEKAAMEKGVVEAVSVGERGLLMYRSHVAENGDKGLNKFVIGEEATPYINSFREKRLRGA